MTVRSQAETSLTQ